MEMVWRVEGDWHDLNPVVEQTVYRVADEALLNVERHSAARRVEVSLMRDGGTVRLMVRDDGQGFAADGVPPEASGRFGLAGMGERAELVGGELEIESEPGRGTIVRLTVGE
jgi:signal transduction histidine kinase